MKTTSLVRNELGHVLSLAETFKWYDAKTNAVIIGYTSSYMAYSAKLFGEQITASGVTHFEITAIAKGA